MHASLNAMMRDTPPCASSRSPRSVLSMPAPASVFSMPVERSAQRSTQRSAQRSTQRSAQRSTPAANVFAAATSVFSTPRPRPRPQCLFESGQRIAVSTASLWRLLSALLPGPDGGPDAAEAAAVAAEHCPALCLSETPAAGAYLMSAVCRAARLTPEALQAVLLEDGVDVELQQ